MAMIIQQQILVVLMRRRASTCRPIRDCKIAAESNIQKISCACSLVSVFCGGNQEIVQAATYHYLRAVL